MFKFNLKIQKKYTAVMIEPRKHPAMELVLKNFTRNLDLKWQFIIFHGNKNLDYIKNIIKNSLPNEAYRFKFINLNVDNLSTSGYNSILYDPKFYENIPTETFLIFQTDSIICDKHKDLIYDFIDFDYVGAPWQNKTVGNGGLSLRKKSKMLKILNQHSLINNMNEDIFFSSYSKNKPNFNFARYFSIETVESDRAFGIHNAWSYLDTSKFEKFCPDLNLLKKIHYKMYNEN